MSIKFPLVPVHSDIGILYKPFIPVFLKTPLGALRINFLLDSGADYSVAPRQIAESMGLDLGALPHKNVSGLEGGKVKGALGKLSGEIAGHPFKVRCLFTDRNDVPSLLGRLDFFDRFDICFDAKKRTVILDPTAHEK